MAADHRADRRLGILFIICSAFCFALMNLFIRLAGDVPTLQKCFFRNFFAMLIAGFSLLRTKTPLRIGKGNLRYLLVRSVAGGLGMVCNFYAVDHLAISDASMLNKLSPFFAMLFSAILLHERVSLPEWASVLCAFGGAMLVVKPQFGLSSLPAAAGFLGGLGAGLAYANVRKLGVRGENSMIIVAFFSAFTTLMLTPSLLLHFQPMSAKQWCFLILTGMSAAGGQIFITKAYAKAPAKEISVFDFSIVLFAAVLGYLFLGQIPDWLSVAGYIIIIGTAVLKWYLLSRMPNRKEFQMKGYQGSADFIALCFSQKDKETAEHIAEQLQSAGLRVWCNDRGCRLTKTSDRERFSQCRTVLILISANWLEDKLCTAQLAAACELERQHVLLFLDGSDLTGNELLVPYLGRSVRMLDYNAANPGETLAELTALVCITDCKAAPGESDGEKPGGLLGLFRN